MGLTKREKDVIATMLILEIENYEKGNEDILDFKADTELSKHSSYMRIRNNKKFIRRCKNILKKLEAN